MEQYSTAAAKTTIRPGLFRDPVRSEIIAQTTLQRMATSKEKFPVAYKIFPVAYMFGLQKKKQLRYFENRYRIVKNNSFFNSGSTKHGS